MMKKGMLMHSKYPLLLYTTKSDFYYDSSGNLRKEKHLIVTDRRGKMVWYEIDWTKGQVEDILARCNDALLDIPTSEVSDFMDAVSLLYSK